MNQTHISPLSFYANPGPMTDAGESMPYLKTLPSNLAALCEMIQKLVVHIFWAERMGLKLPEDRQAEVQIRPVSQKIVRALELDPSPLQNPRPLEKRLVCNCRDISTLMTAVLRAHNIPARARCGFATYFLPDHYEDHWVVETWDAEQKRWLMVDAQLDEFQRNRLKIQFDPLDMPAGQFIPAGQGWQMCRKGEANPDQFGIHQWHGMAFIRGNVARDLLSLNKIEVLPWDSWGWLKRSIAKDWEMQRAVFDQAAELTLNPDENFTELQTFYKKTPGIRPPSTWTK